jgi:hypothetical protein
MDNIIIEGLHGEYFVPSVNFDADKAVCELAGESYLEETRDFYAPLISWLEQYNEEYEVPLTFNFKLTYFNTSSSRCILDVLHQLKKVNDNDKIAAVNWFFQEDDEDMQEEVEDFIFDSEVEINLIPFA